MGRRAILILRLGFAGLYSVYAGGAGGAGGAGNMSSVCLGWFHHGLVSMLVMGIDIVESVWCVSSSFVRSDSSS